MFLLHFIIMWAFRIPFRDSRILPRLTWWFQIVCCLCWMRIKHPPLISCSSPVWTHLHNGNRKPLSRVFCIKSAIFYCHHPAATGAAHSLATWIMAVSRVLLPGSLGRDAVHRENWLEQCVSPINVEGNEKIPFKSDETWNHIIYIIFTFCANSSSPSVVELSF